MKTGISDAIIMRTREFGEADLLVTFLTPGQGQLQGIAKGGRRSIKRFANSLDTFSLVVLEFELRKRGSLPLLQFGKLVYGFPKIRSDYSLFSLASYMLELTEVLFPVGVADRRAFDLLKNSLYALEGGVPGRVVAVAFEANALALGGYGIDLEGCCICGRRYGGQGTAVFLRDRGGVACMKCRRPSEESPPLSPTGVKTLDILQSEGLDLSKLPWLSEGIINEMGPVLRLHREYRIGKPLKTARHVD